MLQTLRIQNYALIDDLEVDFTSGFNVLTGETGAGKSIVVGALNLVLGARASSEVVREGAVHAKVDAIFRLPHPSARLRALLSEHSLELDGDELLVSRVISAEGRGRAYLAGSLVPVSVLAQIGDELVDLHGQHEHQSLLRPDRQLALLDGFGGHVEPAVSLGQHVRRLRELEREIERLASDDRDHARRLDFLRFEIEEIDKAGLVPGEEEELKSRRNRIANAERIYALASTAYQLVSASEDPPSAVDSLAKAIGSIDDLASIDDKFAALALQANRLREELQAVADELREYSDGFEFNPRELDEVNTRLSFIRDLSRKYGNTVDDILAHRDKASREVEADSNKDQRLAELRGEHAALLEKTMAAAHALSASRIKTAKALEKKVSAGLQDLGMKGARFEVQFERVALSADGIDKVEFALEANAGERMKPLRQVASGGEISRIMLALKAVFAHADRIPSLIFDEIDAGVGGAVANQVAAKMADLSRTHQVIAITHLPQIAAAAQSHFTVAKSSRNKRTITTVTRVEGEDRVKELARLLDGSLTAVSLEHARALLGDARIQSGASK